MYDISYIWHLKSLSKCYTARLILILFFNILSDSEVLDISQRLDIGLLIGGQTKPTFDRSKDIAKNLINNYGASTLQKDIRFALIKYSNQPSLEKSFSNGNDKIALLEQVDGLKYRTGDARLDNGLEFMQSKLFSECKPSEPCSTLKKPTKALIAFTDRELDVDSKSLLKKLGESGVKVVVVVISNTLSKNTFDLIDENIDVQIYPIDGGKDGGGGVDGDDGNSDKEGGSSDDGDEIDNIIDQIEQGLSHS